MRRCFSESLRFGSVGVNLFKNPARAVPVSSSGLYLEAFTRAPILPLAAMSALS